MLQAAEPVDAFAVARQACGHGSAGLALELKEDATADASRVSANEKTSAPKQRRSLASMKPEKTCAPKQQRRSLASMKPKKSLASMKSSPTLTTNARSLDERLNRAEQYGVSPRVVQNKRMNMSLAALGREGGMSRWPHAPTPVPA